MTILEKKSERKKKAILYMVEHGEYSIGYALSEIERLSDEGRLTEIDYEEVAEYLEELMNQKEIIEEPIEEETEQIDTEVNSTEQIEEPTEEITETEEETTESEE